MYGNPTIVIIVAVFDRYIVLQTVRVIKDFMFKLFYTNIKMVLQYHLLQFK
jgi:hypothetical protein